MDETGLYGGDLYGALPPKSAPAGVAAPVAQSAATPAPAAPVPSSCMSLPSIEPFQSRAQAPPLPDPAPVGSVQYEAATAADRIGAAAGVVKERRTVSDDDDSATAETVRMMCDYIRQGAADPGVKFWAKRAIDCYGLGSRLPAVSAWAVFWMVKHCVKYVHDEGRLFQSGDKNARDRLVSPQVLVRQAKPEEDCDGFTMLVCALLQVLGVPCSIVTVKANPRKPSQWSHVFAMAEFPDGTRCALDGSHGAFPGWMVPREHIYAYQVWDLQAKPIATKLPAVSHLHGYTRPGSRMRRRGLGDCPIDPVTGDTIVCTDPGASASIPFPEYVPGVDTTPGAPPASSSSGINWTAIINSITGNAAKVATVAVAPPGSYINPATGQIITGAGPVSSFSSGGSLIPLAIGAVILIALFSAGGKK